MAQKYQFRKGFLKLQRLGPIKFTEQSRWKTRAPEMNGMWAFPYPHFDLFYAYHKYTDLAPKGLRERQPKDPKWYLRSDNDEPVPSVEFRESTSLFSNYLEPGYVDEEGNWIEAYLSGEFYRAKEEWVENVGKKILPLRTFWYSGEIYTHFNRDGSVGGWTMGANEEGNDWTLMHTADFEKILRQPGSVVASDGHRADGKPALYNFSKDHLEIFLAPRRGIIRDRL